MSNLIPYGIRYSNLHGPQVAAELMSSLDLEGHNPLDCAAEAGNVNVIEFLIRRGLNPLRLDHMHRSGLYWAVKANKPETARFLVLCGCDPHQKDIQEVSPFMIAQSMRDWNLLEVLSLKPSAPQSLSMTSTPTAPVAENQQPYGIIQPVEQLNSVHRLYYKKRNLMKSLAVYRRNMQKFRYIAVSSMFFLLLWLLPVLFPFYTVLPAYVVAFVCLR